MRHRLSILIFAITVVALSANALAHDKFFNEHPTLWKDADILIWSLDKEPVIDPKEFCLSLKRINSGIGEPKCRLRGLCSR